MAWMTVEAAAAIAAGIIAASIALVGFGLDSVIEFFAAAVVIAAEKLTEAFSVAKLTVS